MLRGPAPEAWATSTFSEHQTLQATTPSNDGLANAQSQNRQATVMEGLLLMALSKAGLASNDGLHSKMVTDSDIVSNQVASPSPLKSHARQASRMSITTLVDPDENETRWGRAQSRDRSISPDPEPQLDIASGVKGTPRLRDSQLLKGNTVPSDASADVSMSTRRIPNSSTVEIQKPDSHLGPNFMNAPVDHKDPTLAFFFLLATLRAPAKWFSPPRDNSALISATSTSLAFPPAETSYNGEQRHGHFPTVAIALAWLASVRGGVVGTHVGVHAQEEDAEEGGEADGMQIREHVVDSKSAANVLRGRSKVSILDLVEACGSDGEQAVGSVASHFRTDTDQRQKLADLANISSMVSIVKGCL
ncbi:hypothetical protein HDU93_007445 [Gonapodya sp. JEL0774]|nr:hypothetical protein HDU93_007445 [Gonapodya sp. JEL0774]